MISLIICSRSRSIDQALLNNIDATIGIPYEIIFIDNSENVYSICSAYNLGVKRSIYSVLCFMHDDIIYHTADWGKAVLNHINNDEIDVFGIAGAPYYAFMPGPWWGSGDLYEHILQSDTADVQPILKSNSAGLKNKEVVVFDGVWFCIKKELFEKIGFDEANFKGFHFYDADICMQLYSLDIKMYCVNDILVQHTSMGAINKTWIENALLFHEKWEYNLPALCSNISYNQQCRFEYETLNCMIWICSGRKWSNTKIYKLALKYLLAFKKGYLFYKTPGYMIKFMFKMLFKKGAPFYCI